MKTAIALCLLLVGCATYQPGDGLSAALQLQARYCAETDPYQRAVALAMMKRAQVPVPARGACTDLLDLIPEGELADIDVEAARRDAERARERTD